MVDRLVELVRQRKVLYDAKCKDHKDHSLRNAAWEEIAEILNEPIDKCKEDWTKLRNSFASALKRRRNKSGQVFLPWKHEDIMNFLLPYMEFKNITNNIHPPESTPIATGSNVKTKWQYMRDTYRRELAKSNSPPFEGTEPKWKYFQDMNFLQDIYTTSRLIKNEKPDRGDTKKNTANESDTSDESHELDSQIDDKNDTSVIKSKSETSKSSFVCPKKKPRLKIDPPCDLAELDNVRVANLQGNSSQKVGIIEEDEDYFFLMSLLPHLRGIPKRYKLRTRNKLQQVLIEEQALLEG